ncbi:MAG: caleosin family protein [Candidatus Sericytochromatia bacterium]
MNFILPPTLNPFPLGPYFQPAPSTQAGLAAGAAPEAAKAPQDTASLSSTSSRTPLQRHVDFFDRDGDHQIHVSETYAGLRALGAGLVTSGVGAVFINAGLGVKTGAPWYSPLVVSTDNIAAGKHDSDTDIYDAQGQFHQDKFDAMFAQFDCDQDGALSEAEFKTLRAHNKETTAGGIAAAAEFNLLVKLAGQKQESAGQSTKVITKAQLQDFYNGGLFYHLAGEKAPF